MSKPSIPIPIGYKVINEGISSILIPENQSVFYNPVQEFNRDLSMLVALSFSQLFIKERLEKIKKKSNSDDTSLPYSTFRILDALTASGFRAIRYAHQVPLCTQIIANDLDVDVKDTILTNIAHNSIKDGLIQSNIQDAK